MAKEPYNWLDDPFDPEKERLEEEEMRHSKRMGLIGLMVLLVIGALILFAGCAGALISVFSTLSSI